MKALDFLSSERKKISPVTILTGDDLLLKNLVINEITANLPNLADIEKCEAKTANEIARQVGEGSLFGIRLVVVDLLTKKWGSTTRLKSAMYEMISMEDNLVVKAEALPSGKEKIIPPAFEIDCTKVTHKKSRKKFISYRLEKHGLKTTEDALKSLVERTETTGEIESVLIALKYAFYNSTELTQREVIKATAEPSQRKDINNAMLAGNTPRIIKEVLSGEPVYTLTFLYSVLLRIYTYLEMDEAGATDDAIMEVLNIQKRSLKNWKATKTKYSSKLIRQLMEVTAKCYQQVMWGRTEVWKEELQFQIKKLGKWAKK